MKDEPQELGIDDPSPRPGWLPSLQQIAKWSAQIKAENMIREGLRFDARVDHRRKMEAFYDGELPQTTTEGTG